MGYFQAGTPDNKPPVCEHTSGSKDQYCVSAPDKSTWAHHALPGAMMSSELVQ